MVRPGWESAGECCGLRARVQQLARRDWAKALNEARDIPLIWYRVQSMATVVQHAPEEQVDPLLRRAIEHANTETDAYRRLAVLRWVAEAALERGRPAVARAMVERVVRESPTITPTKSRAYALESFLDVAKQVGADGPVAEALAQAAALLMKDSHKKWRKWGKSFVRYLGMHVGPARAAALIEKWK